MRGFAGAFMMILAALVGASLLLSPKAQAAPDGPAAGQMCVMDPDGSPGMLMPLKGTAVEAEVAGFGARVTVRQRFTNPSRVPIEAVYTFPLPNDAAVDRMTMKIGDRVIEGQIKTREMARRIYNAAKAAGQSAALLDQERPNVFTQSVANVMPGRQIDVEISYVQVLKYEAGQFEFSFPMVVGPRFTDGKTPDPDKISPPIVPKGTRSGQTISLNLRIDAGAPIQEINSVLHKVNVQRPGQGRAVVSLQKQDEIPNRDFILRYRTATDSVQSALLTHYEPEKGGFFSLVLLPPKAPTAQQIAPREIIFVMDQSGSQQGFPIQKSKELTLKLVKTLRPGDTFNVIGFNNAVRPLWDKPRALTDGNLSEAQAFVNRMEANGGTQLREGVVAALQGQDDPNRLRIVLFNTDGYVGDEKLVLDAIRKNRHRARMFTFGIGNSVNRYLIDSMSEEGRGAAEYVTLAEQADQAVQRFVRRSQTPVLTDVSASVAGVTVTDALPEALPDVFDESPVVLFGRYATPGRGTVTLRGTLGTQPWSKTLPFDLPATSGATAIPSLWARKKVDELSRKNYIASVTGEGERPVKDQIQDVALEYGIMSEYTSFVAVEQKVVNIGGRLRKVRVPVEMADGVSYEGIFGGRSEARTLGSSVNRMRGGFGGGAGGGIGGGAGGYGGAAASKAAPSILAQPTVVLDAEKSEGLPTDSSAKIAKGLLKKKGKVEVQIAVASMKPEDLQKLKDLGLTIDHQDKDLKVVFGKIDAAKLKDLAKLPFVQSIEPVEE
jgi:Ca-activated chloride channel family protein